MMNIVLAVFTVTDSGLNCSDVGLVDLATSVECKAAVTDATSFNSNANYKREFSGKDFRKGCYIWDRQDGDMWFNKHSTGGTKYLKTTRSVCKNGNID